MPDSFTYHVSGTEVPFSLEAQPGARQAFFVLGVRKSGSSILNSMVAAMARHNGVPFLDVGGILFAHNVRVKDWIADGSLQAILRPGIAYGGFRNYPEGLASAPLFREGRKVLLVRDPRDALVSEYFSNSYSHSIPAGDAGTGEAALLLRQREAALRLAADEYVRRQSMALLETLRPILALPPGDERLLLLRYEDVILRKEVLLRQVAAHFGWRCEDGLVRNILSWADVRPAAEDPRAFIRKVTPGDHREKLTPDTIRLLNTRFAEFMERFGYEP